MEMKDDWFPETVVRRAEDETPKKGSKYETIRIMSTVAEASVKPGPPPSALVAREPGKPYFTPGGTLVVPVDAPPRYRWWAGGISLDAVIAETSGLACPVDFTDQ